MANTGEWIKAVDTIEPTVKLRQKGSLTEKTHKTHPGFKPWTTGASGKCANHCATAASYPLPLLFYLINVTNVVV